jgi:hypothetical protein
MKNRDEQTHHMNKKPASKTSPKLNNITASYKTAAQIQSAKPKLSYKAIMLNSHTADPLPAHTFQPMPEKNRHRLPLQSGAGIAEKAKPALC